MTTREVILDGGSPWGFRMHGGADLQQRLRISRVNPGSKASFKGVREGDFITSIDGQSTKDISNSEAHALLKSAGDHLKLCLNEEYIESSKRRKFKTVIHETHSETIKTSCISSSTTYTSTNELMENNRSKPKAEENHSNGVISQRSTLSSSASIDSPNSSDIRGPIGIGNVLLMEGNLKKDNYEYRVDSPNIISTMIKSRSLDDEQPVITEINDSEDTSSESNNAIMVVNDADDIIWESTQELNNSLFTNHELANLTIISCEEKVDLRKFLESLDFSGIPTSLIQEFKPITNLDVISEEGSDISSEMDMIRPSFGEIKYETPIVINIDDICKIGVIKSERGSAVIERLSSSSEEDSKCGVVTDRLSRSSSEDSNYCDNKLLELTSEIISAVKNSSTEDQDNIAFRKEFNDLLREQSLIDHDNNKRQVSSESDESCYSSTTVVCSLQNEVIEEKTIVDEEENLIKFIEEAMCNSSKADSFNENNLNNSNKERAMDKTNNNNVAVDQINQEISRGELETFQIDSDKNVENKITNLGTLGTEEVCESNISGNELIEKQHNLDSKNCIQTYLNKINIDDSLVSLDWTSNNKPNTLRELCLNSLTSLPFGLEMLEELAQVAKHLEKFTTNVPNLNFPLTQNYKQNNSNFPSYLNIFKTHILDSKRNNLLFKDNNNNYNDDKFINNQRIIDQKNRRFSLPHEYLVKQMQYLIDCEKEIQEELEILENEKRRLQKQYLLSDERNEMNILSNPEEILRQEMFNEYMRKVIARKERQNKNVIKISLMEHSNNKTDHHNCNDLENEFIRKARYRLEKQGQIYENIETSQKLGVFKVLDENSESDEIKESESIPACSIQKVEGVWSPGQKRNFDREELHREISQDSSQDKTDDTIPPVWTPRSAGSSPTSERKEFRPVNFESPVLGRKERTKSDGSASNVNNQDTPWGRTESSEEKTLTSSYSAPGPGFLDFSRLPKAQNPTITLLQRAREGQIPKSSSCSETNLKANVVKRSADPGYNTRTESFSDSDGERSKKTVHIISPKKYDGIGPTNKDGMPLSLRSEIRDANMSQWYKNMYDTIHKQKPSRYDDEEYVTVRYKQRRVGKYPFSTGYLSEPEVATYDSDAALTDNKYSTLDRRRPLATKQINHASSTLPRTDTTIISYTPEPLRSSISYKSPPGRIEHYKPGQSSISDNESKKWWDEVMEIFDGWPENHSISPSYSSFLNRLITRSHLEQQRRPPQTKGYLSQALKESGYESDSTLVFRRRDDTTQQLSPQEQREVYKIIQKGGEVPLHGLRKLAPERPKEVMEVEYFPISETLNRIRVHKTPKVKSDTKVLRPLNSDKGHLSCSSNKKSARLNAPINLTKSVVPSKSLSRLKSNPARIPNTTRLITVNHARALSNFSLNHPPSPPRRKSSRNNPTLRLISNMQIKSDQGKRHETCFTSSKTNVKKLREKISSKMSPHTLRKMDLGSKASTLKTPHICRSASPSVSRLNEKCTTAKNPRMTSVDSHELLKSSSPSTSKSFIPKVKSYPKLPKHQKQGNLKAPSPIPSLVSEKSRSSYSCSMDSLRSSTNSPIITKPVKNIKMKKSKKDQINVDIVNKNKSSKSKLTTKGVKSKPEKLVKEDIFFQSLLLKEVPKKPQDRVVKKTCLVNNFPKTQNSEKTVKAITFYLNQTKPVTRSKFKQIDHYCRARSTSPKNVLWKSDNFERSISLPPRINSNESLDNNNNNNQKRLFFSETNRPISPVFRSLSPKHSTKIIKIPCSPSSKKIKKLKKVIPQPEIDQELTFTSSSSTDVYGSKDIYPKINYSRFRELNNFYRDLEKLEKLEKTTLSKDLLPRRRNEDQVIDYDRWQEIRTRERAEKEFNYLYDRLKLCQKEKDFLFRPKEVRKWKCEVERGLNNKEKSVENIKEKFENIQDEKQNGLLFYEREVYKPLWRGNSVINLAQTINENRSQSEGRVSKVMNLIDAEKLLSHGIGSRIWSSLSLEQVNILKDQLTEIYGNDSKFQKNKYSIDVRLEEDKPPVGLKVRRNSDILDNKTILTQHEKKKLITEQDKKKISLNLSKEVLARQRGKLKNSNNYNFPDNSTVPESPRTCYSLEISEDDTQKLKDNNLLVIINDPKTRYDSPKTPIIKTNALINKSLSTSETDSTDGSNKTVIYNNKDKISEKVDYFEHISERNVYSPVIHQPLDCGIPEDEHNIKKLSNFHSRSYQDLNELYGEKSSSPHQQLSTKSLYTPPDSPKIRIYRKDRSMSPYSDSEIAKASYGVNKLKKKFEEYFSEPKRWSSNPELNRVCRKIVIPGSCDVNALRMAFEYPSKFGRGRSRYRRGGVVSPIHLKADDRFMPHINIISKIASLYPKKLNEKTRSSEELASILGIPLGEVEKLRQRFDSPTKTSILGQMFTSSPNINELRDIAQYLTGSWIAHKYPRQEDNTKILRSKSTSPISPKRPLTPILKQQTESDKIKRNSSFLKHEQPKYRSWWPPSPTHARPSVKFKEPESPPTPPHVEKSESDPEQESPRKYVENEVTIHYKAPIRQEIKESLSEDELARRQADAMRKIYEEERRRKYLQELHDIKSRRHTDNFIPSQKSPIPLNRYDDILNEYGPRIVSRPKSPEPRLVARALYNFVGQTSRELTFKKGDMIYIRRQVDKNWYEGEINAMVGLFPANYVEIVPYDSTKSTPRKPNEGQARAKYNFIAQTHLELSLAKGELVVVTRRVDDNWFEGRIGGRKGIFPVSYVEVLIDPTDASPANNQTKPVASPAAHSLLLNGSAGGKESMGTHTYVPSFPSPDLGVSYRAKPIQITGNGTYGSLKKNPVDKALHIETQSEPIPYRALYKYRPQNEDELELFEGDTVYVLEKCDDGWYVGSSERTGSFGTFPGNYVERI